MVSHRVARRIGALGGVRRTVSRSPSGPVAGSTCALLRATAQEAALVAAELREAHLLDGVPWSQMAVVVRGQGPDQHAAAGASMSSGVPVAVPSSEVPVRDEVAVRPLLVAAGRRAAVGAGRAAPIDPETAVDAVLSPLGGADAVGLRRLRRALRREELDAGGGRTSDELLAAGLVNPDFLADVGPEAAPARRVARAIAAGVEAARTVDEDGAVRWAPGVDGRDGAVGDVGGDRAGPTWRAIALGGGLAGARADRDLDAVVALFDAAARFVDRLPQPGPRGVPRPHPGPGRPRRHPRRARAQRRHGGPADPAGRRRPRVALVVVAGVQEGVWPDLRLRGSLLGSEQLVDVVTGRGQSLRAAQAAGPLRRDPAVPRRGHPGQRAAARHGRAQRGRAAVGLPRPRRPARAGDASDELRPFTDVARADDPAGPRRPSCAARWSTTTAGRARGRGARPGPAGRASGCRGADPRSWWALRDAQRRPPAARPRERRCGLAVARSTHFGRLRAALGAARRAVAMGPSVGAANIGTLVHDIAAELGDVDADTPARPRSSAAGAGSGCRRAGSRDRQRREAHAWSTGSRATTARRRRGLGARRRRARHAGRARPGGGQRPRRPRSSATPTAGCASSTSRPAEQADARTRCGGTASSAPTRSPSSSGAFAEHGSRSAGAALLQSARPRTGAKTTLQVQQPARARRRAALGRRAGRGDGRGHGRAAFAAPPRVRSAAVLPGARSRCPAQPEGSSCERR